MISRHVGQGHRGLAGLQRHRIVSASTTVTASRLLRPTIATRIPGARFESTTTTTTPEDTTGHISAASNESIIWIDSELKAYKSLPVLMTKKENALVVHVGEKSLGFTNSSAQICSH